MGQVISAPAFGLSAALYGLLGTGVDAAQALKAFGFPKIRLERSGQGLPLL